MSSELVVILKSALMMSSTQLVFQAQRPEAQRPEAQRPELSEVTVLIDE